MRGILTRFWLALRQLDNRDIHVYGGLTLAALGGLLLSPAWACITVGAVLVLFGLFGPILERWMLNGGP